MSFQLGRPDLRDSKTLLAGPVSSPSHFSTHSLFSPDFGHYAKKGALRLVQSVRNPFIISIISQKIAVEKREKTSKIDPNSTLFRLFLAFFGTWSLRLIVASSPAFFCHFLTRISASETPLRF